MQSAGISNSSSVLALQALLGGATKDSQAAGQNFPVGSASSASSTTTPTAASPSSQFSSDLLSALIAYQAGPVAAAPNPPPGAAHAAKNAAEPPPHAGSGVTNLASNAVLGAASGLGSLADSLQSALSGTSAHHPRHPQTNAASTTTTAIASSSAAAAASTASA